MSARLPLVALAIVLLGLLALEVGGNLALAPRSASPLSVAAASDLRLALAEIAQMYQTQTGVEVVLTFGSTGQLTQQIEQGAPFDVFLAANEGYIERLRQGGQTLPGTERRYARGRLVLVTAPRTDRVLERMTDLLDPAVRHVAIANPDHAPYGQAARQALEASEIWGALQPKLVYGENIQQALQFVQSGQAEAGLVALALAQPSELPWVLVPQELHQPLDQALAIIRRTEREAAARAFVDFVLGDAGQSILQQYGFEPPGDRR